MGTSVETVSGYDEAYNEVGVLRPTYALLRERLGWDSLRPPSSVAEKLRDRPLGDDARILPIPWAIDDAEYEGLLRPGIAQRARALQMFFADVILGSGRFLAGSRMTVELFNAILASEGTSVELLQRKWAAHEVEEIRFVFGPDVVRDPHGRWMILEDNVGCVGGTADSFFVLDAYARATCRELAPSDPHASDLSIAVQRWMTRLDRQRDGVVLTLLGQEHDGNDPSIPQLHENARRQIILETLDIHTTDGHQIAERWRDGNAAGDIRALVNFTVEGGEPYNILDGIAFGQLHLPLMNSPGTGLLGNKALLPYVADMIRFYCDEEPLLEVPTTNILLDGRLPDDPTRWVIKLAAGCQGTGVFVLGLQSSEQLVAIGQLLRTELDSAAVAQVAIEPSRLSPLGSEAWDAYRLELRPIAYVLGWQDVFVADQPVGKAVSNFDVRRLNNLAQGACYIPVIRVRRRE
jgi:hypothetical protein